MTPSKMLYRRHPRSSPRTGHARRNARRFHRTTAPAFDLPSSQARDSVGRTLVGKVSRHLRLSYLYLSSARRSFRQHRCRVPNECCRPNRGRCVLHPVGTRGGVGWMRGPCAQYISLKPKRGKKKTRKLLSGILPESKKKKPGAFDVQITRNGN